MGPADSANRRDISRYLSRVLRHEPECIGLSLDAQGWIWIDDVIEAHTAALLARLESRELSPHTAAVRLLRELNLGGQS